MEEEQEERDLEERDSDSDDDYDWDEEDQQLYAQFVQPKVPANDNQVAVRRAGENQLVVQVPQDRTQSFLDISHLLSRSVIANEELPKIINESQEQAA